MTLFITFFVTSFIVALSGAIMPGPLLTVTITESSRRGMMTGPLLIAGHAILELALVLALLMGLAPMLKMEPVFIVIALAGSAVLLWMGIGMLKSLPAMTLVTDKQQRRGKKPDPVRHPHEPGQPLLEHLVGHHRPGLHSSQHKRRYHGRGCLFHRAHTGRSVLVCGRIRSHLERSAVAFRPGYRILIGTCAVCLIVFSCLFAWSGCKNSSLSGIYLLIVARFSMPCIRLLGAVIVMGFNDRSHHGKFIFLQMGCHPFLWRRGNHVHGIGVLPGRRQCGTRTPTGGER
jgi:hypothetical protein